MQRQSLHIVHSIYVQVMHDMVHWQMLLSVGPVLVPPATRFMDCSSRRRTVRLQSWSLRLGFWIFFMTGPLEDGFLSQGFHRHLIIQTLPV